MWFPSWKFVFCAALCLFTSSSLGVAAQTTAVTLPPPTYCCTFDTNTCYFDLSGGWNWSATSPSTSIPYSDGEYIWTSTNNTVAYAANQYGVSRTTTFSFDYFLSSPNVQLEVSFVSTSPIINEEVFGYLYYSSTTWATKTLDCHSCCMDLLSCDGQLQVRLIGTSGYVGAIDNAARDETCGNHTYPCCDFNDATMCGFSSTTVDGLSWLSSAVSIPDPPMPSPDSNFVYFDATNLLTPMTVSLSSPLMNISNNVQFTTKVFINVVPYNADSVLQFSFQNTDTGDFYPSVDIASTFGEWQSNTFDCVNCCDASPTCTVQVVVQAIIEDAIIKVQFGIDNIGIYGGC